MKIAQSACAGLWADRENRMFRPVLCLPTHWHINGIENFWGLSRSEIEQV